MDPKQTPELHNRAYDQNNIYKNTFMSEFPDKYSKQSTLNPHNHSGIGLNKRKGSQTSELNISDSSATGKSNNYDTYTNFKENILQNTKINSNYGTANTNLKSSKNNYTSTTTYTKKSVR